MERADSGSSLWVAAAATAFLIACIWGLQLSHDPGLAWLPPFSSAPSEARGGEWLTQLVLHAIGLLPLPWPTETVLSVFSAVVMSLLIAWLHQRLLYNDWHPVEAFFFVAFLAANATIIGSVVADHTGIATMIAAIAVIPGIRRMESVGDVQANMSFGLVLPLLFLAGPATAPLILPLALFGAFSDPTARDDIRAFVAMLLVAIMPTLLVLTGMLGMFGWPAVSAIVGEVYLPAFTPQLLAAEASRQLLTTAAYTILPFAIVTIAYMLVRDRRWQPVSAVAVLVLPAYLIVGTMTFSWPVPPTLPTVAFLGAFASWLSVARLSSIIRRVSIVLMLLTAALSWSPAVLLAQAPH
jgi:hypothetical protein